jgi:regulator of sigma D
MSNEKMPLYRAIKEFNQDEFKTLLEHGLILVDEKYTSSSHFSAYNRIVVRKKTVLWSKQQTL